MDSFKFINCTLPTLPLSVILHRTSIQSAGESDDNNGNPTTVSPDDFSDDFNDDGRKKELKSFNKEIVSEVKSLKLESPEGRKVSVTQLMTLFNGLESLEKLSMINIAIELPSLSPSSSQGGDFLSDSGLRSLPRVFVSRTKRAALQFQTFTNNNNFATTITSFRPTPIPFSNSDRFGSSRSTRRNNLIFSATVGPVPSTPPTIVSTMLPTSTIPTTMTTLVSLLSRPPTKSNETTIGPSIQPEVHNKPFSFSALSVSPQSVKPSAFALPSLSSSSSFSSSSSPPSPTTLPFRDFPTTTQTPSAVKSTTESIDGEEDLSVSSQTFPNSNSVKSLNFKFSSFFPKLRNLLLDSFMTTLNSNNGIYLKEIISDLNSLETLQLRSNYIPKFPGNVLASSLKRLYLTKNSIRFMDIDSFAKLNHLQVLDLSSNNLRTVPEFIFKDLIQLESLNLGKNSFKSLPGNLITFSSSLKVLDLNTNRNLSILPQSLLMNGSSLETLKLVDCYLPDISSDPSTFFQSSSSLHSLEMRGNRLKNLTAPNLFGHSSKLTKIDLSFNDIEIISPAIFSLNSHSLVELNLHGNNLKQIDHLTFNNLKNLRSLRLSFNSLQSISPDLLFSLRKLEELDLSRNQITSINPTKSRLPFGPTAGLRRINLANNNLTDFNEFTVIEWTLYLKISSINLSKNQISGDVVLPVLYSTSPQVTIDLSSNQISTVLMNEIINYESVVMSASKDEKVASERGSWKASTGHTVSQVIIHLDNNPLSCDCFLEPFVAYARSSATDLESAFRGILNRVSFDFTSPNLKCANYDSPLHQIDPLNLTCPLQSSESGSKSLCPSSLGCDCRYRSKDSHLLVNCSHKGLKRIPEAFLNPSNYRNISIVKQSNSHSPSSHSPNERNSFSPSHNERNSFGKEVTTEKNLPIITISSVENVTLDFSHNEISKIEGLNRLVNNHHPSSSSSGGRNKNNRKQYNSVGGSTKTLSFELYLDDNRVSYLPENFLQVSFRGTDNKSGSNDPSNRIRVLSLRNNQLTKLPVSFLNSLTVNGTSGINEAGFDLESNPNIASFASAIKSAKVYLGENPFNCTPEQVTYPGDGEHCSFIYFKTWLAKNTFTTIQDVSEIKCAMVNNRTEEEPRSLIEISDTDLCPQLAYSDQSGILILSVICIILSILLVIMCILYYQNKHTILAFIYIHVNPVFVCLNFTESDLDEDKLYDAFISYSSADRDVVMEMIDKLEKPSDSTTSAISFLKQQQSVGLPSIHEGKRDQIVPEMNTSKYNKRNRGNENVVDIQDDEDINYFNLCIHERDWLPGNLISWNIVNSVQNSRRTVLILSQEFIKSIWFQIEFHTAYYQMLEDKMDRLIVIVRGELPPKEELDKDLVFLLTTKTYLVWGERWFWEKLRYALPHKSKGQNHRQQVITSDINKSSTVDTTTMNRKNKSISSLFSSPGNTLSNTLKLNGTNNSNSHRQSKSDLMKEFVDQTIADHFQLQATKMYKNQQQESSSENVTTEESTNNRDYGARSRTKAGHVNDSFVAETET